MLQAGDPLPGEAPDGAGSAGELLAVFDEAVAELSARLESACAQTDGWLERTRAGLQELLRFCDERPDTARSLVVESIAWGPEVLLRRGQLLDKLAEALASGEGRHAAEPPGTAENLVGACVSLVHTRLLQAGGGTTFLGLAPSLMSMIVHLYLGPAAARRELERSLAKAGNGASERGSDGPAARVRERSY
jgi:hypothetical protein